MSVAACARTPTLRGLGAAQLQGFRERTTAARAKRAYWLHLRKQKMCEGCGLKCPGYGLASERKARWCAGCGAAGGAGVYC